MKKQMMLAICSLFLVLMSVKAVRAADQTFAETFAEQFVGSPLLILAVLMIIAGFAFLYHRMTK